MFTPPPAPPPSRRELNRLATESAIVNAALTLAEDHAWSAVTVDRVAEVAGVSRRTFFNYFGSLEEALHRPLRLLVESAALRMSQDKPSELDILTGLVETLAETLSLDLLEPAARVLLLGRDNPALREASLKTWDECVQALLPPPGLGTPPMRLFISTLVRSAVAAAQAAFEHWAEHLTGPLEEADVAKLRELIAEAMGLLRDGFTHPHWLSEADLVSCEYTPTPSLTASIKD